MLPFRPVREECEWGYRAISVGWSADRLHRAYREALIPDEQSATGLPTVDAAVSWLKSQHCR
jgi:hypothetical protein